MNTKILGTTLLIFLFSIAGFGQPATSTPGQEKKFPESGAYAKSNVTYKIIDAPNKTFCYDIFADGKLLIHQPSIPGVGGNDGFKTKGSAEKVAGLVVKKIKAGEMPPTVTKEEMQKLNAIK